MLRAAFLLRPTAWPLWGVRAVTGAPVHCEVVFADGHTFTSSPGRGTHWGRLAPDPEAHPGVWHLVECPGLDEAAALAFCERASGRHYGWASILGYPLNLESRTSWMCAETVAHALHEAGGPFALVDAAGSPARLYRAVLAAFPSPPLA